jgi:hypothetical protein
MAGGTLVYSLIPERYGKVKGLFWQIGPFAILSLALLERITGKGIFSPYLNPLISAIYGYIQM